MSEEELQRVWILRKLLHDMDDIAAIEFILDKLKETKTNEDFFNSMKHSQSVKKPKPVSKAWALNTSQGLALAPKKRL
jgi:hypothetical protein